MANRELLQKRLGKMLAARQKPAGGPAPVAPAEADLPAVPPVASVPQVLQAELPALPMLGQGNPDTAATVQIGSQARHLLDRTAFIRQIEAKLAGHPSKPVALRPYGLDRLPGELPDTWEDLDREVEVRRRLKPIPELKLGGAAPASPVGEADASGAAARSSRPVLRGLEADLDALSRIRQLGRQQAALLDAVGKPAAAPKARRKAADKPVPAHAAEKPARAKAKPSPSPSPLSQSEVEGVQPAPAATGLSAFMATPAHLEWQSRAQLDMASFFMDELQVRNFRDRICAERMQQLPLQATVFQPQRHAVDFTCNPRAAETRQPDSALFNEQEFDAWVASLEEQFPPLYKQEQRLEKVQIGQRTREALKLLPLLGRNVTLGSLLNSWVMMGHMGRVRALVVQPDFIRLDNQETLEQELYLGQSGLPSQRNHTLFKSSDHEGYLSGSAIHLFRPRQLVAPHEDAEGFLMRVHPLLKRHFAQAAFTQWFDKVYTTSLSHTTLIESFVADAVQRHASIQKKLLKQALVVSKALTAEYGQGEASLGGNTVFNMQFYQQYGFLPAPSFYEFLQCPVADAGQGGNRPLWQVLGEGSPVQWQHIGIEEHPMELVLMHVLAIYALSPVQNAGLVKLMGLLDLLIRCGDYFETPMNSPNLDDQRAIDKSLGLLKAYEQVLSEDAVAATDAQHSLGSYRFAWDRHTQQTPVDEAHLPSHQESQLVEAFHGLCKQMQAAGIWRNDIARLLQLSQLALATA